MGKLAVVNIKMSGILSPPINFEDFEKLNFSCNNVGVGRKNIRLNIFNYTLMGHFLQYINLTGIKDFNQIKNGLLVFMTHFRGVKSIKNMKIDSIFFKFSFKNPNLLREILDDFFEIFNKIFIIKKYILIKSRINLRLINTCSQSKNMSINIFKTGNGTIFGARNRTDARFLIKEIYRAQKKIE